MVERLNVIRVIVDSIPSSRPKLNANVAKLAYARDLKSLALKKAYRFKSDRSHQKTAGCSSGLRNLFAKQAQDKNLAEGSNPSPAAISL